MKLTKKMIIAGAGAVGAVGIGSAAFAFFSTNGSGTGSAGVISTQSAITFANVVVPALVPGTAVPVPPVIATNSNGFVVRVGALKVTNVVVTKTNGAVSTIVTSTCPVIVSPDTNGPYPLAKSTTTEIPSSLALTLDDTLVDINGAPVNQNVCLGAAVTFDVTADAVA